MKNQKKVIITGLTIWFTSLLFYVFECFLRVFPNTISDNLMNAFHINAEEYSYIGSFYFISYALMQIPIGLLINKFGVRKLLILASFTCSLSVFWFALSNSFISILFSRLLMGFASSFAFISLLALALNWLPKKHFAFFSGFSQFIGSLGPFLAGAPFAFLLQKMYNNWHLIFLYLGIVSIVITFLIMFFVKNKPRLKNQIIFLETPKSLKTELIYIIKNKQIWWVILYTCFIYVSMPILGTYWGVLFLQNKNFDKATSAFLISLIWIGYAIASPIIGKISDMIKRRILPIAISAFIGTSASLLLLYYPTHNNIFLIILFFSIGVASSGQALSFALARENVRSHAQTTIFGLTNMLLMISAAIIPAFIGAIIHQEHHSSHLNYMPSDFIKGLTFMPILYFLAFLISIFCIKETFCRSQHEIYRS